MKKVLLFVTVFAVCGFIAGCGDKDNSPQLPQEPQVKEKISVESAPGEEIKEVISEPSVQSKSADNTKIIIDSEFMAKAVEDSMQLDSKDFDFYQIASFSNYDKKNFKYYMVSGVQVFGDISSLLILAASEHENVCWLVNYDKNNKYIASLIVGYDEWADGSNGIDSVINIKSAPYYVDGTNRSMDSKEIVKTEVLSSGKFNEISRMNVGTGM